MDLTNEGHEKSPPRFHGLDAVLAAATRAETDASEQHLHQVLAAGSCVWGYRTHHMVKNGPRPESGKICSRCGCTPDPLLKYTVQIEASSDGDIWQAVSAPETVVTVASAESVAEDVAANQDVVDGGLWRVRVWEGSNPAEGKPDLGTDPKAEYPSPASLLAGSSSRNESERNLEMDAPNETVETVHLVTGSDHTDRVEPSEAVAHPVSFTPYPEGTSGGEVRIDGPWQSTDSPVCRVNGITVDMTDADPGQHREVDGWVIERTGTGVRVKLGPTTP